MLNVNESTSYLFISDHRLLRRMPLSKEGDQKMSTRVQRVWILSSEVLTRPPALGPLARPAWNDEDASAHFFHHKRNQRCSRKSPTRILDDNHDELQREQPATMADYDISNDWFDASFNQNSA